MNSIYKVINLCIKILTFVELILDLHILKQEVRYISSDWAQHSRVLETEYLYTQSSCVHLLQLYMHASGILVRKY
jgi:hypothetical protein